MCGPSRVAASSNRRPPKRIASRSRREKVRTLAVCTGALLLMALGLYFGLSRQEAAAGRGSRAGWRSAPAVSIA